MTNLSKDRIEYSFSFLFFIYLLTLPIVSKVQILQFLFKIIFLHSSKFFIFLLIKDLIKTFPKLITFSFLAECLKMCLHFLRSSKIQNFKSSEKWRTWWAPPRNLSRNFLIIFVKRKYFKFLKIINLLIYYNLLRIIVSKFHRSILLTDYVEIVL